nr:heme-binding protein [Methylogaea oryzae]
MEQLTLASANTIVNSALSYARQLDLAPLAVVVDAAGCPVAMQREDGSTLLRPQIAQAKAWGAVAMGMPSRALGVIAAERPAFMNSLVALADGKMAPVPAGY